MTRETEITEVGDQTLIDGVRPFDRQSIHWIDCLPVSPLRDRLGVMAALPMTPKRNPSVPQKPCDHGLFDEVGRAQLDLCDLIQNKETET